MNEQQKAQEELNEALKSAHQQWLQNPVTASMVKAITKHKDKFVQLVAANAASPSVTDQALRHYCISIRDFEMILNLLRDSELFIKTLNEQPNKTV